MNLSIQSIMWLLPIVFMIHDFEEIIMMRPWYRKNEDYLKARFPRIASRIASTGNLSTPAFAFAALEEFVIISAITLACVEYDLYSVWAGVLLGFFLHLVFHAGSFLVLRRYVPYIVTSVFAGAYSIYALTALNDGGYMVLQDTIVWTIIMTVVIAANLLIILKVAELFDQWLTRWSTAG